jgi:hypothetical protein
VIDRLTLPEVYDIFERWKDWPPVNELLANVHGWERPFTFEEKIERGAMGPADFHKHFQTTKGKLQTS